MKRGKLTECFCGTMVVADWGNYIDMVESPKVFAEWVVAKNPNTMHI